MGMLDRYRKSGGFNQLLILLETSPKDKQEKFLGLIKDESPTWETELRKRIMTFDRVCNWEQPYLMEICPRIPEKIIAVALHPIPAEKRTGWLKSLSPAQRRTADEILGGPAPQLGEVFSCQNRILTEIREMAKQNALKLDKIDPGLMVPEDIEETLGGSFSTVVGASAGKVSAAPAGAPVPATSQAAQDEIIELRRKVHQLQNHVEAVEKENKSMRDKLDQIKKIA